MCKKAPFPKLNMTNAALLIRWPKPYAREYNVSYDFLIYGEGDPFDDLPQTILDELCLQYELDDIDRQIIDLYISLPKELRDKVKAYVLDKLKK